MAAAMDGLVSRTTTFVDKLRLKEGKGGANQTAPLLKVSIGELEMSQCTAFEMLEQMGNNRFHVEEVIRNLNASEDLQQTGYPTPHNNIKIRDCQNDVEIVLEINSSEGLAVQGQDHTEQV